MQEYIESHPYPSYDEMIARIDEHPTLSLQMYAEYGEVNHNYLKQIYESNFDVKLTRDRGRDIYARGGLQAMIMNCAAFSYVGPFVGCTDDATRYSGTKLIEIHWNGIGGFQY